MRSAKRVMWTLACLVALVGSACTDLETKAPDAQTDAAMGNGGAPASGGDSDASGGEAESGGIAQTGGEASGGDAASGGATQTGGDATGGEASSGGSEATGGNVASGGTDASGGDQTPCVRSAEVCDGEDNDCDGNVDNGQDLCATGETCHQGECVGCITDSDCADNPTACKVGACNAGTCSFQQAPAGTECRAGSVCTPTGSCVDCYGSGVAGAVGCDAGEGCYAGRCSKPVCGNGIIETPDEECDPAVTNDYHCDPVTCQLTGATVTAFQPCQTDDDCDKCPVSIPEFNPTTVAELNEAIAWHADNCGGHEVCVSGLYTPYTTPKYCMPFAKTAGTCDDTVPTMYTSLNSGVYCSLACAVDAECPAALTCGPNTPADLPQTCTVP